MVEADAAEYVGVSLGQFRREVEKGIWPRPVNRNARLNTYDRKALDDAVDRLAQRINLPARDDLDEIDLDREFGLGGDQGPLSRGPPAR